MYKRLRRQMCSQAKKPRDKRDVLNIQKSQQGSASARNAKARESEQERRQNDMTPRALLLCRWSLVAGSSVSCIAFFKTLTERVRCGMG